VTAWWNRIKRSWLPILGGLTLVICVSLIALRLVGPKIGNKFCTLVDVLMDEGVVVHLIGQNLPRKYIVEVDFPSGKKVLECDSTDNCSNGAYLRQPESGYPPEKLTITVIINNRRITQTFAPEYQITLPNGEGCEPVYYTTEINFPVNP
jgi:hypothetical protein